MQMKDSTKTLLVIGATAAAATVLAAVAYYSYRDGKTRPKRKRKQYGRRSSSQQNVSGRPCCVVTPISPTKVVDKGRPHHYIPDPNYPVKDPNLINELTEVIRRRSLDVSETEPIEQSREEDDPLKLSSYSSLDSDETYASASEGGSKASSQSNSDTSLTDARKSSPVTPMKPLSEDEFHYLLNSPIIQPMHEDVRMSRSMHSRSSSTPDIVKEYEPSVVDSAHDSIYGVYHDIVPPLQPYTRPVIFQSPG